MSHIDCPVDGYHFGVTIIDWEWYIEDIMGGSKEIWWLVVNRLLVVLKDGYHSDHDDNLTEGYHWSYDDNFYVTGYRRRFCYLYGRIIWFWYGWYLWEKLFFKGELVFIVTVFYDYSVK